MCKLTSTKFYLQRSPIFMFESNRNVSKTFSLLSSTVLLGVFLPSIRAVAEPIDFLCARTGGEFKTMVRYSDSPEKTHIVYSSTVEGKSPEVRCRESSRQLRLNFANGFKHTTVGQSVTGKPVICAVKKITLESTKCSESNILLHLDKSDDGSAIQRSLEKSIDPNNSVVTLICHPLTTALGDKKSKSDSLQVSLENLFATQKYGINRNSKESESFFRSNRIEWNIREPLSESNKIEWNGRESLFKLNEIIKIR